jgi:hypothetical protein
VLHFDPRVVRLAIMVETVTEVAGNQQDHDHHAQSADYEIKATTRGIVHEVLLINARR